MWSRGGPLLNPFSLYSHQICSRWGLKQQSKLIALWVLLEAAKEKDVAKLQVFGDSKMAIDWACRRTSIEIPHLASIMRDIKLTFRAFERLSFHHILRELNTKADELSKQALEMQSEAFSFYEYMDGREIEEMEFRF
jgi:hypothetical protein